MAAQKGRDLLLELEDTPGSATYTQIAGMRSKNFQFSRPNTDTSDDQSEWQELTPGMTLKSLSWSGQGIYKSHATQKKIFNALWNASAPLNFRVTVPGLGVFVGPFVTDANDFSGGHENELSFSAQFRSAGTIAYTPI